MGVQTGAGHQHEVAAISDAQMDVTGRAMSDGLGDLFEILGVQADFQGQDIGGSQGNDRQGDAALSGDHAVDHLVDGAVAAGGDHHVIIGGAGGAGEFFRVAASCGLQRGDDAAFLAQAFDHFRQALLAAPASSGVMDDEEPSRLSRRHGVVVRLDDALRQHRHGYIPAIEESVIKLL